VKRIARPSNGAMTRSGEGAPPACPCVEPFQAAYCAAWHSAHVSDPMKSA
jgi:hypothetical protein